VPGPIGEYKIFTARRTFGLPCLKGIHDNRRQGDVALPHLGLGVTDGAPCIGSASNVDRSFVEGKSTPSRNGPLASRPSSLLSLTPRATFWATSSLARMPVNTAVIKKGRQRPVTDSVSSRRSPNPLPSPRYGFHSLRQAAASLFIAYLGWTPKRVQTVLGHSFDL
jgi:hypothetical protein